MHAFGMQFYRLHLGHAKTQLNICSQFFSSSIFISFKLRNQSLFIAIHTFKKELPVRVGNRHLPGALLKGFDHSEFMFSTSVELESDNVCLCICLSVCPKTLGRAGGFKNGSIWLKFGTLIPWVNLGVFFHFSKILIFWAL